MAYVAVDNFSYGLDRRRSRFAGTPGSLWVLENAHITRGGEIERSKKFVPKYQLPADTFGLLAVGSRLYVFGSRASVSVPTGVTYQRLQHPDLTTNMTGVLDAKAFDGMPYVVAQYADGSIFHFLDGSLVTDWTAGTVHAYMTDNTGIAAHLRDLVNDDGAVSWTAVSAGNVVSVTGVDNEDFSYTISAENGGTDDTQSIIASVAQEAVAGTAETLASGSFSVTGGVAATAATGTVVLTGGASGSVDSITVNGIEILGAAVSFNASLNQTALDVAEQINSYASNPEYSASASGTTISISAATMKGATPNGFVVAATGTTITTSTTNMAGGVDRGVSSIKVDGIEVLGSTINLVGSYSALATAIASEIMSFVSSPDYTASASAASTTVYAETGSGASANGRAVSVTTVGGVTVSATTFSLSGGVNAASGRPKVVDFAIGGVFEVGDKFTIKLKKGLRTKAFGYAGSPEPIGRILLPFKTKMHAAGGSLVNFSAVGSASVWNRDNVDTVLAGQGLINAASQDEGSQDITGLTLYHGQLGIFSRSTIQLWAINADPALNTFLQTLPNTGTRAGRSALAYGNNDSFYLDDTGIRSLRARDASNSAYVNDVGTAIDTLVQEDLKSLTDAQVEAAVAAIEPTDARYWLALGAKIYVFSYFPGSKITAWSSYAPGFVISDFARIANQLFARSGDTIYLYGGDSGDVYPDDGETPVAVETPFMTAAKPATFKTFAGFDIGCENEWDCRLKFDLNRPDSEHRIGVFNRPTFSQPRNPVTVNTTHVALRMTCSRGGRATLANLALHFNELNNAG